MPNDWTSLVIYLNDCIVTVKDSLLKGLSSYKVFSNIFGRILSSIYIELDVLKCFDVLEYTPVVKKSRDMN